MTVAYAQQGAVAVLTVDNPPVNALSPAVWQGLDDAVRRAAGDPAVDAVVLTGAGTTFIAGADIKVFATALGIGILIDATIVRALLVPALVSIFGRWNWWLPSWAARTMRVDPHAAVPEQRRSGEPELVGAED